MPTRRSHQKSRRGCLTCKRRHVKCDEGGPPCNRCKTRGTTCEYGDLDPSPPSPQPSPQTDIPACPADKPEISLGAVTFPQDRRRLELQLMHRWATATYKSCCTPGSDDDAVWQFLVPEWALQHEFLLSSLFALAAFDTARLVKTSDHVQYVNVAMEYHALALGSFRSQLPDVLNVAHEAAFCCSLMLMVLTFASAQFMTTPTSARDGQEGMLHNAIAHFEMLRGCIPVAESQEGYIAENPYILKMPLFKDILRVALDSAMEAAFAKLSEFNDRRITATVSESAERRTQQITYWEACKKALTLLRECFEKCVEHRHQGYALGWLNMAGEEYIRAIKEEDHAALLMLMYWGVLVDRCGRQVWWANKFGSLLADEIANRIFDKDPDALTKEIILMAQNMMIESENGK
ncbi:hypothetical protein F5884DRAFT_828139 [Xylogone sp. PMI_703]|nr:hypothetical protein F5884DRAFT_828139 [Xylogone sp. PMI_703]